MGKKLKFKNKNAKLKLKIQNFKFYIVILIFAFCILNFTTGCTQRQDAKKEASTIPVKAMKVKLRDVKETLDYIGDIDAKDKANVYPRVGGKIIEKVKGEGSSVKKGDVIAYIDRDEVGFKFENAPVESPLAGIIGRVYVDKGTQVSPQTALALVVDMEEVKVDLDIPEKYLPKISLGQTAQVNVDAYPKEKFIGTVSEISPVVDLETRTAPIEIKISNAGFRLKPGMFARVELVIGEHKDVPVILKEAVIGKEPDTYVYIVDNNRALLKKITLGIRQGPYYEIKEGIKKDDLVVIMGQQRLRDGIEVSVEEEDR